MRELARKRKKASEREPVDSALGNDSERGSAEKPVSLRPLRFEEAIKGLMRTKPKKEGGNDD